MSIPRRTLPALALLPFIALAQTPPPNGQFAIVPKKGQNSAQAQKDVAACQSQARTHAGADPAQAVAAGQAPAQQVAPTTKGGAGKGALGGAAAGAVIGEVVDNDAGKGAAIGAGVGAVAGSVRRSNAKKEEDAQRQAAEQEKAARQQRSAEQVEQYNLAFRTCLEARGYEVK